MKIALFFNIIGRGETFFEHGFQVSGFRPALPFSLLTPRMKLHEIRCHFHEVSFWINLAASAASGGADT